jgi:hypothetical protein
MTTTSAPSNSPRDVLPDLFMFGLDYPDISPACLVEGLAEYVDTDDADIYLDDIRHLSEVLAAYVKTVEPIVQELAKARAAEEEEE